VAVIPVQCSVSCANGELDDLQGKAEVREKEKQILHESLEWGPLCRISYIRSLCFSTDRLGPRLLSKM
jgi:hypothetical protein